MGAYNLNHAQDIAAKINNYLGIETELPVQTVRTPQQTNSLDCGVYMIIFTDILVQQIKLGTFDTWINYESKLPTDLKYASVLTKRAQLALIWHNYEHILMNSSDFTDMMYHIPDTNVSETSASGYAEVAVILGSEKCYTDDGSQKIGQKVGGYSITACNISDLHDENELKDKIKSHLTEELCNISDEITAPAVDSNPSQLSIVDHYNGNHNNITTNGNANSNPRSGLSKPCDTFKKMASKPILNSLSLVADSQGRGLASCLSALVSEKITVCGYTLPGARLEAIVASMSGTSELKRYGGDDWVVVMGGCNDADDFKGKDPCDVSKHMWGILESEVKLLHYTNVILATIPYRYDLQCNNPKHRTVSEINNGIRQLVYENANVYLLDLYLLERHCHSRHGYHINRKGKKVVSRLLHDIIMGRSKAETTTVNHHTISKSNIEVVNRDITEEFKEHRHNSSVAFAHCISGDFGHGRQMTSGVAVKFRKAFGRPTVWDCVSGHLAYQRNGCGAGVYSLITKLNFNGKPNKLSYTNSFNDLIVDFKKKGFRKLICSPMGCIRDNVPIKDFVKELVQFQNQNEAEIKIVTYDHHSSRMAHRGFIHQLKRSLECELLKYKFSKNTANCQSEDSVTGPSLNDDLCNPVELGNLITSPERHSPVTDISVACISTSSTWRGLPSSVSASLSCEPVKTPSTPDPSAVAQHLLSAHPLPPPASPLMNRQDMDNSQLLDEDNNICCMNNSSKIIDKTVNNRDSFLV